jgi:hypothetical protein
MVGGTRFHRWIHEASLGRNAGKRKDPFREREKRALAAGQLYVSLDRADAIIEGGPDNNSQDEVGCPITPALRVGVLTLLPLIDRHRLRAISYQTSHLQVFS